MTNASILPNENTQTPTFLTSPELLAHAIQLTEQYLHALCADAENPHNTFETSLYRDRLKLLKSYQSHHQQT